ncbi:hypothetical protein WJX84_002544 [Apatococcus fuscideae]|uniref:Uncharacterized protein n=1 Tax=Apatococcus fuscideae TaxID=2026836 RepID=A0AAW1SV20_9CHLO
MSEGVRRTGRQRRPAPRLDVGGDDRSREQALRKSLLEVQRVVHEAPDAPVLHPTEDEWRDFYTYIESMKPLGLAHGILKIIPPPSMRNTPDGQKFAEQMLQHPSSFPVRRQEIHRLQEGIGFDETKRYTSQNYKEAAEDAMDAWLRIQASVTSSENGKDESSLNISQAEAEYWKIVERASQHEYMAEYANDLDSARHGTAFDETTLKRWGWHLGTLADGQQSALQSIGEPIAGVTYPWLYFGMLFASFCWHNEDHHLYSINYHHAGAPKTWYGIPGKHAEKFERALRNSFPLRFLEDPDLLHLLVIQASPSLLLQQGLDVVRAVQEPGEMVVTWPKAYHCGFSHGWNCSEAINFAPFDWLPKGFEAVGKYCKMGGKRKPLFSHDRLVFELAQHALKAGVVDALKQVLEEERAWRQGILEEGATDASVRYGRANLPSLAGDSTEPACSHCATLMFLSCITCSCSPTEPRCLAHAHIGSAASAQGAMRQHGHLLPVTISTLRIDSQPALCTAGV